MTHPQAETLLQWLRDHPQTIAHEPDAAGVRLLEVFSGKQRALAWSEIERIEAATDQQSGRPYVIVLLQNGRQLVLADQGFAFAPDLRNSGPLPIPTSVFCMRDYEHLVGLVRQTDPERASDAAQVILVIIALLDGARAVGLDIGREEREVNELLQRLDSAGK